MTVLIQRVLKAFAYTSPALAVYLAGTTFILLADIYVVSRFSSAYSASWAEARSLFGLLSAFISLGVEMVFVRSPSSARTLFGMVIVQVLIFGIPVGLIVNSFGFLSSPWVASALAVGAAFSVVQGQYYRSRNQFLLSQISQQGWRIGIFVALVLIVNFSDTLHLSLDTLLASVVALVSLAIAIAILKAPPGVETAPVSIIKHYQISLRFFASSVFLSIAQFGEQLIVNGLGSLQEASIYFAHLTYFVLPTSALTSYVGFQLGPWLRDNLSSFMEFASIYRLKVHIGIVFLVSIVYLIGWLGWILVEPPIGTPVAFLQIALYLSAITRGYYILPSTYIGVYGSPKEHDILLATQALLFLAISTCIFLAHSVVDTITIAASAGLVNWVTRTIVSTMIMRKIMARREKEGKHGVVSQK